jgi:hypothetical protein
MMSKVSLTPEENAVIKSVMMWRKAISMQNAYERGAETPADWPTTPEQDVQAMFDCMLDSFETLEKSHKPNWLRRFI